MPAEINKELKNCKRLKSNILVDDNDKMIALD